MAIYSGMCCASHKSPTHIHAPIQFAAPGALCRDTLSPPATQKKRGGAGGIGGGGGCPAGPGCCGSPAGRGRQARPRDEVYADFNQVYLYQTEPLPGKRATMWFFVVLEHS